MEIDLVKVINAILGVGVGVAKKKAQRSDRVIKVLKTLRLSPLPSQADFEIIYAHTLVEYGIDKPKSLLDFFRHEVIRSAFRKAFEAQNLSILENEARSFIEWNDLGKELIKKDIDPRNEFSKFSRIFENLVDRSRIPLQVKTDQRIEKLELLMKEMLKNQDEILNSRFGNQIADLIVSSGTSSSTTMPLLPSYYVSRKRELNQLMVSIKNAMQGVGKNTLALVGIGGTGKTVLAQSVAFEKDFKALFPDGVLWAALGPNVLDIGDIEANLVEWLIEFHQDPKQFHGVEAKISAIRNFIGRSRRVIVIDDVWNYFPAELLLNIAGPNCLCIITTRDLEIVARLGITNRITVGPFEEADAKKLVEKSLGHSIERGSWEALIKPTLTLLEWHPLAVTLVTGQVSIGDLSWEVIQDRLRKSGGQKTLDYEDTVSRRESLRLTFDLSLKFFSEEEALKFAKLGVFPKGKSFTIADAMMIWSDRNAAQGEKFERFREWRASDDERESAEKLLSKLYRYSLLNIVSNESQFTQYQLHNLLHEHALGILSSMGELADTFEHFAWIYTSITLSTHTVRMGQVYPYIEHQLLEILDKTWMALKRKETKLFLDIRLAQITFLYLANAVCKYWQLIGQYEEAIKWLERAIEIAREQNEKRFLHSCLRAIAGIYIEQGKANLAVRYANDALTISDRLGNFEKAQDLILIGSCHAFSKEDDKALYWLEKAQKILSRIVDPKDKGILLDNIGNVYFALKQIEKAIPCYEESVRLAESINDPNYEIALCNRLGNLGNAYHQQANQSLQKAINLLETSYSLARAVGSKSSEGKRLAVLGWAYLGLGRVNLSKTSFRESLRALNNLDSPIAEQVNEQLAIIEGNAPDRIVEISFDQLFDLTTEAASGDKLAEARLRPFLMSVISNKNLVPDFALICQRLLDMLDGERDIDNLIRGLDSQTSHNFIVVLLEIGAKGLGKFYGTLTRLVSDARAGNKASMKEVERMLSPGFGRDNEAISNLLLNIQSLVNGKIEVDQFLERMDDKVMKLLFKTSLSSPAVETSSQSSK